VTNQPHPLETIVKTIVYKGVVFEIVQRPEVLWVGCVGYAADHTSEPDIGAILERYQSLLGVTERNALLCPDWSAALSINYTTNAAPCGMMFANETGSADQDSRLDVFKQPAGLWIRVCNTPDVSKALLGKESAEPYEYFAGPDTPLHMAAKENGYAPHPSIHVQVEYYCHAAYGTESPISFAYTPVILVP